MKRRNLLIAAGIIVVIVGFLIVRGIQKSQAEKDSKYQTATIERGELTAIVGATGKVRANQTTFLSWQTTGVIDTICPEVDDFVNEGDCIATLKRNSLSQNIILAEADLVNAKRDLEDLLNSSLAQSQAFQVMVQTQGELDDALEELESKNYSRASQETLDIGRANLIIAEDFVSQKERIYDMVDSRPENDPIRAEAFSQLASAKKERDRNQANLNWLLGLPDMQELDEAEAAVKVAEAKLDDAEREWERIKAGPAAEDVAAAEARVDAIEATLSLATIEAPFAGTITEISSKVGDQVSPGTITFRLDDLSHLLLDLEVPEVDINRIQLGQTANLTFDAILGREYKGQVVEVARVGDTGQNVVNFTVTIELMDVDEIVRPGMTAAVNIIVTKLENILLIPNRAVRLSEGQRVVYILKDGTPTAVKITIGATSESFSELVEGDLTEGDIVVLNPPADISGQGGPPFMR